MRPRLYCKCLGTRKYTAKPSQRQDSSDRGGKFYLVEFAVQLGFDVVCSGPMIKPWKIMKIEVGRGLALRMGHHSPTRLGLVALRLVD